MNSFDTVHGIISSTVKENERINLDFRDLTPLNLDDATIELQCPRLELSSFGLEGKETLAVSIALKPHGPNFSRKPFTIK